MGSNSSTMKPSPPLSTPVMPATMSMRSVSASSSSHVDSYGRRSQDTFRPAMNSPKGKGRALPPSSSVRSSPKVKIKVRNEEKEEGEISSDEEPLAGPSSLPFDRPSIIKAETSRASPGPVMPAPKEMSPEEAIQYLEIIRNLLEEGFAPEALIRRGATPHFVTQACQDIIDAKEKRKAVWTATREKRAESEMPDVKGINLRSKSPSMERTISVSSESSGGLIERMTSPPPVRLVPEQSWNPSLVAPTRPSAVRPIETWKPTPVASQASVPAPTPSTNPSLPLKPSPATILHSSVRKEREPVARQIVNYGEDEAAPAQKKVRLVDGASLPTLPSQVSISIAAEVATKNALLESRRKVLESMKKRKALAAQRPIVKEETPPMSVTTEEDKQRKIEEEVADLEREMINLTESVPMEIDEPEEGEISDPPDPPLLGNRFSSLPNLKQPRRPTATDLEDRPTSVASRQAVKRRPFGGTVQRPNRLILDLDVDDEDEEEEIEKVEAKWNLNPGVDIIERERLLAEKEESIRKLKEQIAERMRAKIKAAGSSGASTPVELVQEAVAADAKMELEKDCNVVGEDKMDVDQGYDSSSLPQDNEVRMEIKPEHLTDFQLSGSSDFVTYQPLLRRYPQLASADIYSAFPEFAPKPTTDWDLLSSIILTNRISKDPNAVLCMAEVGGGKCADSGCGDVHVEKGMPTDEDLIEFLSRTHDAEEGVIKAALDVARQTTNGKTQASASLIWNKDATGPLGAVLTKAGNILRLHAKGKGKGKA